MNGSYVPNEVVGSEDGEEVEGAQLKDEGRKSSARTTLLFGAVLLEG